MRSYLLLAGICLLVMVSGPVRAHQPPQESQAAPSSAPSLDYAYFKTQVEPIFLKKRPGHARCVSCHSQNNAPLKVVPLSPGETTWNEEESRKNFELVKRVATPGDLQSPLLLHPLAESAGGDFFHNGGKHFDSKKDPEWLTLKDFVLGKKAE
jgi:hypothetical protein